MIQNVGAYLDVPRFLDAEHPVETAADAEAYLARLESYPQQLDGELGAAAGGRRGKGLIPPAFLLDKAIAQMKLSVAGAREGGGLVESMVRRTKDIPGNWAPTRARPSPGEKVAPALERQIAELTAQRAARRWTPACGRGRAATSTTAGRCARPRRPGCRPTRSTSMGLEQVERAAGADGPDPEGPRLHQGLGRRAHDRRSPRTRASSSPRRRGPRRDHGLHPGAAATIRAKLPQAFGTLVQAATSRCGACRPRKSPARPAPTAAPARSTARSPASSGSTCAPPNCTAATACPTSRTTRRFRAMSGRANMPTSCR